MNELDSFTINFITNGLDKLQDQLQDLRNSMDDLGDKFEKGTTKGDSFFGKFGVWLTGLAGLAAGFISIREAINGVFNVSDKIIDLNLTADRVGRTALEVETLSRAMMHFTKETDVGRMFGEAEGLYNALNTITGKAWRLQFGGALTEELNRAGGIIFTGEESDQQMISKIIQGLNYHTQRQDWYSRKQLAQVLGLSDTAVEFLSSGEVAIDKLLKQESGRAHLYTDDNRQAAIDLHEARIQLKDTWDRIYEQLQPAVTDMINKFNELVVKLEPLIRMLVGALGWLSEKFGWLLEWADKIGTSAGNVLGDLIFDFKKNTKAANAYSRLSDFTNPYGNTKYDNVTDLWDDISAVKGNLDFIGNSAQTQNILKIASQRAIEMSNAKLIAAGRQPVAVNNSVEVGTINITGMGEDAANQTNEAIQKKFGDLQPAFNGMGAL